MANSTNALAATITATDPSNNQPINRGLGTPTYAGSVGEFALYQSITGATNLTLPAATVLQVYIKNLAAPGGATITVIGTPKGGASATLAVLDPGSVFLVWEVAASGTSGYTALSLTPSAGTVPVEYFLGA